MGIPSMLNTQKVSWAVGAFEAPVPPATTGAQVIALRAGDSLTYSIVGGNAASIVADPADPSGFTALVTGILGASGTVNAQAVYKNADGNIVTINQEWTVVNASDVVSLTSNPGTPVSQ